MIYEARFVDNTSAVERIFLSDSLLFVSKMARGSYNVSDSCGSKLKEEEKNGDESRECMNSCLGSGFLRSLSLHDRPRSSRVPTKKELLKSRFKVLVSSSLEKIPSILPPSSEARAESGTDNGIESVGISSKTEMSVQPSTSNASPTFANQQRGQNQLSEPDSWLEDKYKKFSVESEKLLEKTVSILRAVDEDISESLINLTRPESIAPESVMETYRNKFKNTAGGSSESELNLSMESSSESICENWQPSSKQRPKNIQVHSTSRGRILNSADVELDVSVESSSESVNKNWQPSIQQRPKNVQLNSTQKRIPHSASSELGLSTESSSEPIYENWQTFVQQRSKDAQAYWTPRRSKDLQTPSPRLSPKNEQAQSSAQSPKIMQIIQSSRQSPKNANTLFPQQSLKNLSTRSSQQNPKNFQAPSMQQSPKNLQIQPSEQSPKNLLASSTEETLNFEAASSSNSENTQSLTRPDSDDVRSVEQNSKNLLSSPKVSSAGDSTKAKSPIKFDLPSDHEQFITIIEALQNRCLEYREMIQDVAISALEECLHFPEPSISQIRHLRCQFGSQKRNFKDFKELCCKSVTFGPDSLPIDEKVTEVIQSFYLKLLQEENETFMVRLEYGLKMGETYAKMLELEAVSKKIIRRLKNEIFYLKKTSVGFQV